MPTYILRNKDTDEQHEEFCTWNELQDLLSKNPKYEQMPTAAALVGDHLMGVGPKIDNGFKDKLTRIADAHPDSALAERYGTKDHKRIKTKQVLKKHGLM